MSNEVLRFVLANFTAPKIKHFLQFPIKDRNRLILSLDCKRIVTMNIFWVKSLALLAHTDYKVTITA